MENFKPQEQIVPEHLENESEQKIDLNVFEEKVKNASPSTLEKIGNALKSKSTWAGMLGVTIGAWMIDRTFNHQGEVAQSIMETITDNTGKPDPEGVRQALLALKGFSVSFLAMSGVLTYMGYADGNDPKRDYLKYKDGYLHKDVFK